MPNIKDYFAPLLGLLLLAVLLLGILGTVSYISLESFRLSLERTKVVQESKTERTKQRWGFLNRWRRNGD